LPRLIRKAQRKKSDLDTNTRCAQHYAFYRHEFLLDQVLESTSTTVYFLNLIKAFQLEEGLFSVSPEQISDFVALQLRRYFADQRPIIIVLNALCGCGGNSIAFLQPAQYDGYCSGCGSL